MDFYLSDIRGYETLGETERIENLHRTGTVNKHFGDSQFEATFINELLAHVQSPLLSHFTAKFYDPLGCLLVLVWLWVSKPLST